MPKEKKVDYFSLARRLIFGLVILTSLCLYQARAEAAESVVLKYRFLQQKVSVPELTAFVTTGKLSNSLQFYLKQAGKDPADLRRALTQEVKVNSTFLYQVLKTPVGEGLLDQVSQVVHTPSNRANRESLRGALVSSALPDGNITLIEVLQNYPTPDVYVEGERLVEVMQDIRKVLGRLPIPRS